MNTFVELRKIRFYAYHGVAEQERCVGNDYEIYVKVKYPFKDAMETDPAPFRFILLLTSNYTERNEQRLFHIFFTQPHSSQ